jgi:gliding motility-associated-like protein
VHSFTDFNVDVNQQYYYRAETVDSCDARDTISNIASNILLRGKAERNDRNQIYWTPYSEFDGRVAEYEVYRSNQLNGGYELLPETVSGTDTLYFDNIRPLAEDDNTFCYYVRALEGENTLPIPAGFGPFSARSNRICLTQEAKVYIPNAFRPGSPSPENRIFAVKSNYIDTERFSMKVFNRWGELVFESSDPAIGWDGTFNGSEAPTGVYSYVISFATKNGGLLQDERGSITLIR